jgi:hypothetical protein
MPKWDPEPNLLLPKERPGVVVSDEFVKFEVVGAFGNVLLVREFESMM